MIVKAKEIKLPRGGFGEWRIRFKVVGISKRSHSIRVGKIRRSTAGRFLPAWALIDDEQSEFYSHFSMN